MITLSQFINHIKRLKPTLEIKFRYPSLYLVYCDESFTNIRLEDREAVFFHELQSNSNEEDFQFRNNDVEAVIRSGGIQLILCSPEERSRDYGFLDTSGTTSHWAEFLADSQTNPPLEPKIPFIHFYGYKGGQARSTVLAMLAKNLASDGYKVLVVDADLEAPSLHTLFEVPSLPPSCSLLGCALYQLEPTPQSVFFPIKGLGRVDLLLCRPSDCAYDLDAANFALHAALDPSMVADVIQRTIRQGQWDVILIDHRTGVAPSVLPIVVGFPGPVIACMRLDEQSTAAAPFFSALFRQHPSIPGLLLSFSLNPKETRQSFYDEDQLPKIERALEPLANELSSSDSESIQPENISDYCIPWFHDGAFLSALLPDVDYIRHDNKEALNSIRNLLGLLPKTSPQLVSKPSDIPKLTNSELTGSGNTDKGTLIQNEAIRKLLPPSTPYTYIVGRKGTGKTRLFRSLADKELGEPILVAEDYLNESGIRSGDSLIEDLVPFFQDDPVKFWWVMLDASLNSTKSHDQQNSLQKTLTLISDKGVSAFNITSVKKRILTLSKKKVFLIDGVETAFTSSRILKFVEGLFRFLASIQSDSAISQLVTIRLFIRTDLVAGARENIEQQIENRTIYLAWNTRSILNFVLARVVELPWFNEHFAEAVEEIKTRIGDLTEGAVSEEDSAKILRLIFPEKVKRLKVLIHTFLTTYFSDGQGDKASFYPRVYDSFLHFIAEGGSPGMQLKMNQLENKRVAQNLITEAHVYACQSYLDQVKDELKYLIALTPKSLEENANLISDLLSKFNNRPTPFHFEKTLSELVTATSLQEKDLRKALQQMKRIGIFEERPGYKDQWRAGRLFKSSLGMLYNRKRKDDENSDDML